MKSLYIILFVILISCVPRVVEKKGPLSQEVIVNKVLEELNLDKSKIHLYDVKASPNNLNETVLIFVEEEGVEGSEKRYTSHILIINSVTGKVKKEFSEKSTENGWISDAIFIDGIRVDDTKYQLSKTKKAFGVIVRFRSNSQPNPFTEESISLFVKEKGSLKKVLDSYTIYKSEGEVNVNACHANFNITENKLSINNEKNSRHNNIIVRKVISQRHFRKDKNGECNPVEKVIATEEKILRFNGKTFE